jgi:hypothetical protein
MFTRTQKLVVAVIVLGLVALAFTWFYAWHGQHWLAVQTGTDYCVNLPPQYTTVCERYGYWSGFGSVWPWSLLGLGGVVTAVWFFIRKHNCHEPGCLRVGRVTVDDKGTLSCFHHYPEGKPRKGHIQRAHDAHHETTRVLNEIHKHVSALTPQAGTFPPDPG